MDLGAPGLIKIAERIFSFFSRCMFKRPSGYQLAQGIKVWQIWGGTSTFFGVGRNMTQKPPVTIGVMMLVIDKPWVIYIYIYTSWE